MLSEEKFNLLTQTEPPNSTSLVKTNHNEHVKGLLSNWSNSSLPYQKNGGMQIFKLPSVNELTNN